jgi:hypothetical protein
MNLQQVFDTQGIETVTQLKLYMLPISKSKDFDDCLEFSTNTPYSRIHVVRPQRANNPSALAESPVIASATSFLLKTVLQAAAFQTCNIHKELSAFSEEYGSASQATEKNAGLKGTTVFRNWIGWQAVTEKISSDLMSEATDNTTFVFGAMFSDLEKSLSSRYLKSKKEAECWLSLKSGACEESLPSPVMRLFLSLAQDMYLSTTDMSTKEASTLSVFHGLGLPATFVNSKLCTVSGLKEKDETPASLLSNELNLLKALLFKLGGHTQTPEGIKNLCAVFPLPLVELVKYLHAQGSAVRNISADALFVSFLLERLDNDASAPVSLVALKNQVRESVLGLSARRHSPGLNESLVCAVGAGSLFANVVKALSKFQHEIRYQTDECQMPKAGEERAYLNSIFRNWMCKVLDFQLPAEIAQFDLLLRANRAATNSHFNDYSSNAALVEHLSEVAASAAGKNSVVTVALSAMTKYLEGHASGDDALFVFDEHGPVS